MKSCRTLRYCCITVLTLLPLLSAHAKPADADKSSDKYAGYRTDGRATASVLAAKRSHAVSKEDETGLALFSGLIAIGALAFAIDLLTKRD